MPRSSRHARWEVGGGAVETAATPVTITNGAVTAWLRNNTVGAIASVPDMLNPGNPAVQATGSKQPIGNANGSMTFDGVNDCLTWALTAANNGVNQFGIGLWLVPTSVGTLGSIMAVLNDASASKITLYNTQSSGQLKSHAYVSGNNGRSGQINTTITLTPQFVTLEYDKDGATEALQLTLTRNASVLPALTFLNVGSGGTLGALPSVTGSMVLGDVTAAVQYMWAGTMGRNIYIFGSKMAGATQGLLTPAARTALMNYEPLT